MKRRFLSITLLSIFAMSLVQSASAMSLPVVFQPKVKAGDVLVYTFSDKVTGAINHTMELTRTYVIQSVSGSGIRFQETVANHDAGNGGPPPRTLTMAPNGVVTVVDGGRPIKPARLFMLNANQFGIPPVGLAVGSTWTVALDVSEFGLAPGMATVRISALQGNSCALHIDFSGSGSRTMVMQPGQPASNAQFTTQAHADVQFVDGIITRWQSTSKETQNYAGGSNGTFYKKADYVLQRRHP